MKCLKVITASPGLSGSGLISDFLLSQNDFETPFANLLKSNHQAEFRFTHDPGGLLSLYKGFYDNFSITNSSYVFEEFNKYIEKLKKFSIIKNKKKIFLYDNYFFDLIEKFKKKIVKVEYYGLPQFYRLGLGRKERILWRLINKFKSTQEVKFFKMIIPVDENLFVQEAKNLLEKYFKKKIRGKKILY